MSNFHDSENARARDEALRSSQPRRGSRPAELWAALARYLSGELEHERRTGEHGDKDTRH